MKKILTCLLICICLCGCANEQATSVYDTMVTEIKAHQDYKAHSTNFETVLYVNKLDENRYQYDVIINQPKVNMDDVRAIVICENEESYVYPSIGFAEGEHCFLYPNLIDQKNNYFEGIRLSGVSVSEDVICRLYVTYHVNQELHEEYIILKG